MMIQTPKGKKKENFYSFVDEFISITIKKMAALDVSRRLHAIKRKEEKLRGLNSSC